MTYPRPESPFSAPEGRYPLPHAISQALAQAQLAAQLWSLFDNPRVTRLLHVGAQDGALTAPLKEVIDPLTTGLNLNQPDAFDAIEMAPHHQEALNAQNATLVAQSFLTFHQAAIYSHVLLTPSTEEELTHVLHAWDILFSGEIVACLSADALSDTSCSLVSALNELVQNPEVGRAQTYKNERGTYTLVHLKKTHTQSASLVRYLERSAEEDQNVARMMSETVEQPLNDPFIMRLIGLHHRAVRAQVRTIWSQIEEQRCFDAIAQARPKEEEPAAPAPISAQEILQRCVEKRSLPLMREVSWDHLIEQSLPWAELPEKTAHKLKQHCTQLRKLAFNAPHVYAFLNGITTLAPSIQESWVLEVFDLITNRHNENTCYYLGWNSSKLNLALGLRIKTSRFILVLPHDRWGRNRSAQHLLAQLESVFLLLDGKTSTENSLASQYMSDEGYRQLLQGERIESDYFSVRFYSGGGTMHFYPTRPELIEQLNVYAGQARGWLPTPLEQAPAPFLAQFKDAERVGKQVDIMTLLDAATPCRIAHELTHASRIKMDRVFEALLRSQRNAGLGDTLDVLGL